MNAIDYLMGLENRGVKFGLNNIRFLLDAASNPQSQYRSVHIAGTNGKGSVAACIAAALRSAGLRVGVYTSPHLIRFNERIVVDGQEIPDRDLARLIERFLPIAENMEHGTDVDMPTFFEMATAIAFAYFADRSVDFAVIETGLGGRLDSTNVIKPDVAVITNVAVEHTDYLGSTLRAIAEEKAGIINGSGPVVTAVTQPETVEVIESAAERYGVNVYRCGDEFQYTRRPLEFPRQLVTVTTPAATLDLTVGLAGAHQADNVAVAAMTCVLLREAGVSALTDDVVRDGFTGARWPCRMEVVRRHPMTIIDAAHNSAGAAALRDALEEMADGRRIILVLAMSRDKDVAGLADILCPIVGQVICTRYNMHRSMPADELLNIVRRHVPAAVSAASVPEAIAMADDIADNNDIIVIAGSVFTAGDALPFFSAGLRGADV